MSHGPMLTCSWAPRTGFLDSQFDKPCLWLRFIDDIFLLWPHGPDSLTAFLKQLNSRYPVHFTWNTSPSHVTFLDVDVRINYGQFRAHQLPTISPLSQLLPTSTKRSIPYSSATRGRHIFNHPDDLHTNTSNLTRAFTSRDYPIPLIQKQLFCGLHQPNSPPPGHPSPVSNHHLLSWPSTSQTDPLGRFPQPLQGSLNPGPPYQTPLCHFQKTLQSPPTHYGHKSLPPQTCHPHC